MTEAEFQTEMNSTLKFAKRDILDIICTIVGCREEIELTPKSIDKLRSQIYHEFNAALEMLNEDKNKKLDC